MFSGAYRILQGLVLATVAACAFAQESSNNDILRVPAFSAEELTTPPTNNWITNGGTTFNHYSPLSAINCRPTHAFNTWTASYKGGWVQNPGNRVPGPSESFPPDAPPSFVFAMFPTVYPFPYHYPNPVSGRQ